MKYVGRILTFFILFVVIQYSLDSIFSNILSKSNIRFSKIYNSSSRENFEAVCFGNSRGVNSFYTPYFKSKNLNAFNFSYNGLNIKNISTLVMDYVDSKNTSSHIFIEISAIFNHSNSANNLNLYSSFSKRIKNQIKKKDKKLYFLNTYIPLYKYNNELFYRALYYINKDDQHWINQYNISEALIDKVNSMNDFEIEVNEYDLQELKNLLLFLEKKNLKYTLFIAPYLPDYRNKILNYDSSVEKINLFLELSVLDLSLITDNYRHFADRIHTNKNGAIEISEELISTIYH